MGGWAGSADFGPDQMASSIQSQALPRRKPAI